MKIEILGTGCAKCHALETVVKHVADMLGVDYEIAKITEIAKFSEYGVMMTPALVVDGEVKVVGKVPGEAELTAILTSAASRI